MYVALSLRWDRNIDHQNEQRSWILSEYKITINQSKDMFCHCRLWYSARWLHNGRVRFNVPQRRWFGYVYASFTSVSFVCLPIFKSISKFRPSVVCQDLYMFLSVSLCMQFCFVTTIHKCMHIYTCVCWFAHQRMSSNELTFPSLLCPRPPTVEKFEQVSSTPTA